MSKGGGTSAVPERLMRVYWASASCEDPANAMPAAVDAAVVRNRRRDKPFSDFVFSSICFMVWLLQGLKITCQEALND